MMLVSLVENSIKHGLEPKTGPGAVHLSAIVSGPQLVVKVEDDGLGLASGLCRGVGLANIREQLNLRYGDQASLEVAGRALAGTVSTISVPYRPTPP
jgi:LytS/YehU family sensor histidine kinase